MCASCVTPERSRRNTGERPSERADVFFSWAKLTYLNRSITLTKNSQFYVRHGDVERLIAQGYLQRLS